MKRRTTLGVEPIDRLHQGDSGNLPQVLGGHPATSEPSGNPANQTQMCLNELIAQLPARRIRHGQRVQAAEHRKAVRELTPAFGIPDMCWAILRHH